MDLNFASVLLSLLGPLIVLFEEGVPSKKSRIENIKTEEKEDESPRVTSKFLRRHAFAALLVQ